MTDMDLSQQGDENGATPNEGATPVVAAEEGATPTTSTPPENGGEVRDPEALLKAYNAEKQKRKDLATQVAELSKWRSEREKEAMTEQERVVAELEEARQRANDAESRWQDAQLRSEFVNAAHAAGMNPLVVDDVFIAQKQQGGFGINEDGVVTGVNECVQSLLATKPVYFGQPKTLPTPVRTNAGAGSNGDSGPSLSANEALAAGWFKSAGITTDDYLANKAN